MVLTKESLETTFGKGNVWTTEELCDEFEVVSFLAPIAFVRRRSDGIRGVVQFIHSPRFYFDFEEVDHV